ncbi:Small RNA 2'-O-methyltransferase, partial [Ananas comosus]
SEKDTSTYQLMGTKAPETGVKKPTFTPKALIHQKYASKASYRIEEVQETLENGCPGLAIGQQSRILYRCFLDLPELSVVSDTFTRKKDAEQSAAQIAVEKLGIQSNLNSSTPEEAWNELVARMSGLFTDEVEAVYIPCEMEEQVSTLSLLVSDTKYYMDEIAEKLNVNDSSQIIVSRTVGKASSDMKLYFPIPEACIDVNMERLLNKRASYFSGQSIYGNAIFANIGYTRKSSELFCEDVSLCSYYSPPGCFLASYLMAPTRCLERQYLQQNFLLHILHVLTGRVLPPRDLLCVFCRQQRLSEPIFSVTNVDSYEISSELSGNCKEVQHANGGIGGIDNKDSDKSILLKCEVKIFSRRQETLAEFSFADTYRKESDAIQNSALKVLNWFDNYLKQLDMPIEKISSFGSSDNIKVYPQAFAQEFAMYLSVYGVKQNYFPGKCSSLGSFPRNLSIPKFENGMILFSIDGPDSGVFPSPGSLTCISYATSLVKEEINLKEVLESNDEFEFEVGTGAVISQIEACVTQLSINQAANFVIEAPSREIILAAAGESANRLSQLPLDNCFLEFSVKVLRVTEPLEDRMEKALFSPPLSKQRVEFAVRHINESQATTLVDFGCGSGSLLDSLLEHTTSLEKIVGVDISRKESHPCSKGSSSETKQNLSESDEIR